MPSPEDVVSVRITASQTIHYDQTVSMMRAQYEALKKQADDEEEFAGDNVAAWINTSDIEDAGDVREIEVQLLDADGAELDGFEVYE